MAFFKVLWLIFFFQLSVKVPFIVQPLLVQYCYWANIQRYDQSKCRLALCLFVFYRKTPPTNFKFRFKRNEMLCSIIVVVIICILTLSYSLPVFLMHRSIHVHRDKDNSFVFIVFCWKWFCKLEQIVFVCLCVCACLRVCVVTVFLNLTHRCWEDHTQFHSVI